MFVGPCDRINTKTAVQICFHLGNKLFRISDQKRGFKGKSKLREDFPKVNCD